MPLIFERDQKLIQVAKAKDIDSGAPVYKAPDEPDCVGDTAHRSVDDCIAQVMQRKCGER